MLALCVGCVGCVSRGIYWCSFVEKANFVYCGRADSEQPLSSLILHPTACGVAFLSSLIALAGRAVALASLPLSRLSQ